MAIARSGEQTVPNGTALSRRFRIEAAPWRADLLFDCLALVLFPIIQLIPWLLVDGIARPGAVS